MNNCQESKEHWGKIRNLSKIIVDYLVNNAPNLWKLLYYCDPKYVPLNEKNLTKKQISNMIVSNAREMYTTNAGVTKSILFQEGIDEAFQNTVPQIRIYTGEKWNIDNNRGVCIVHFKIIIPNKQLTFVDELNPNADRSDYIVYELCKALEDKIIPNAVVNSPLFNNKNAPNGLGKQTGAVKGIFNNGYSGQILSFAVLI